jgi:ABC-2 type transport system ATP-binding protein
MSDSPATLRVEGVTKRFGDFTAVDSLSFEVRPGRVFGFLGPNGAGKTTTIRMIVGITAPDSGKIEYAFGSEPPASAGGNGAGSTGTSNALNNAASRISSTPPAYAGGSDLRDRIGYLPEERGLYKKMKIVDQLRYFAALKDVPRSVADERIDKWLARMNLSEWKNKKTTDLSKGMQQKVQFIATVLHDPDLLILDEPFSGLDPVNVEFMIDVLAEFKRQDKTVIFSTHLMETAERLCNDILLINKAKKVVSGSLRQVKEAYGKNLIALRAVGGESVLTDRSLVARVTEHADEKEIELADGADPQALLRRLVDSDADITKFEQVEPSLNDIFIDQVGGSDMVSERAGKDARVPAESSDA